ncbi:MAG: hypothetical protein HC915_11925 [Anaerolineae bacterium]|nr:hypothetical protein [Anaerolineae bacterium]
MRHAQCFQVTTGGGGLCCAPDGSRFATTDQSTQISVWSLAAPSAP